MKKFILPLACLSIISLTSCKKDRTCECTYTSTSSSGDVKTYPPDTETFIKISKSDAKTKCQKSTNVFVDQNGKTSSNVNDCKLK